MITPKGVKPQGGEGRLPDLILQEPPENALSSITSENVSRECAGFQTPAMTDAPRIQAAGV